MKLLLFRIFLSVDSKLYMSCDNSHCTVHRCDKSQEGSGQRQEDSQLILGKLARFRLWRTWENCILDLGSSNDDCFLKNGFASYETSQGPRCMKFFDQEVNLQT